MDKAKNTLMSSILLLAFSVQAQQNFDAVEVSTVELGNGIYVLSSLGGPPAGNILVSIGRDGTFIIDDQYAELHPQIKSAIAELNKGNGEVRIILNTHFHNDHTGANAQWSREGSTIVAHHNARHRMQQPWRFGDMFEKAREKDALPVITFSDNLQLHLNDETIQATHVPNAHTDGDIIVKFAELNLIHAGDVVNPNYFPLFDIGAGGSFDGYIKAVNTLLSLMDDQTRVVPGHGTLTGREAVQKYYNDLIILREILNPLAKSNKNIDAIVALRPLADYEHWSWSSNFMNIDQFTSLAIESLRKD